MSKRLMSVIGFALGASILAAGSVAALGAENKAQRSFDWGYEFPPDPKILARWPDARSCLPPEEQSKDKPDLTKFDWSLIENDDHARVCIYRIASELGAPQSVADWFKSFGFEIVRPMPYNDGLVQYQAVWPMDSGQWPLYPNGVSISALLLKIFSHGQGFYMYWGEDGGLRGVKVGGHTFE